MDRLRVRQGLAKVEPYAIPAPEGGYKWKLDILENQWPPAPRVAQDCAAVLAAAQFRCYPLLCPTTKALLAQISRYCGVPPENVLLTAASDAALKLICEGYLEVGASALVPVPTYPHFLHYADASEADVDRLPWRGEVGPLRAALTEAAAAPGGGYHLCYVCNPGMPLGHSVAGADIRALAGEFPQTRFVIDEAYFEYGSGESAAALAAECQNVIVTRTFSKGFGLAAFRVGYIIAHADTLHWLSRIHNDKSITLLAKTAALAALESLDFYRGQWADAAAVKKYLRAALAPASIGVGGQIYEVDIRHGGHFNLLCRDPAQVVETFRLNGILVRDKHKDVPAAVRVGLGTRDQMAEVVAVVRAINAAASGALYQPGPILLDLDGTLRDGSHRGSPWFAGAAAAVMALRTANARVYLVTNNSCETPDAIWAACTAAGVNINVHNVFTPLRVARDYFRAKDMRPYVVGCTAVRAYVTGGRKVTPDDCDSVFVAHAFHLPLQSSDESQSLADVCRALDNGRRPLYVAELPMSCTLADCGDTRSWVSDHRTLVPDLGAYVAMLQAMVPLKQPLHSFGKPASGNSAAAEGVDGTMGHMGHAILEQLTTQHSIGGDVVVIGDGESDRQLAEYMRRYNGSSVFAAVGAYKPVDGRIYTQPCIRTTLEEIAAVAK